MKHSRRIQQHDAASLAGGYSSGIRRLEVWSIGVLAALMVAAVVRLWEHVPANPWLVLLAVCSAYLGADFISGFVHWMGDTWGTPSAPFLGPALIRPFREHHVDEKAITRHDFVETNGNNCLGSMPGAVLALAVPLDRGWLGIFAAVFLVSLVFWVLMTNQFHKWAHLDSPPRVDRLPPALAPHPPARAPRHPPRRAVRPVLLHHRGVAEPAADRHPLLPGAGVADLLAHRGAPAAGRHRPRGGDGDCPGPGAPAHRAPRRAVSGSPDRAQSSCGSRSASRSYCSARL